MGIRMITGLFETGKDGICRETACLYIALPDISCFEGELSGLKMSRMMIVP